LNPGSLALEARTLPLDRYEDVSELHSQILPSALAYFDAKRRTTWGTHCSLLQEERTAFWRYEPLANRPKRRLSEELAKEEHVVYKREYPDAQLCANRSTTRITKKKMATQRAQWCRYIHWAVAEQSESAACHGECS